MLAKIYRPAKTAVQSGLGKSRRWVLEFEPADGLVPDPLMGWSSSADTSRQIHLEFPTREQAIAHCRDRGIPHQVIEPKEREAVIKSYSDNFAFRRKEPWSH